MAKRDFDKWFSQFIITLHDCGSLVDFEKVYAKCDDKDLKRGLALLNTLVHSKDIETEFLDLVRQYPICVKCIPILLATRGEKLIIREGLRNVEYDFSPQQPNLRLLSGFMRRSGLFDLLQNHMLEHVGDYVTGVEVGLDSNARKNRIGQVMEGLVEDCIKSIPGITYHCQQYSRDVVLMGGVKLTSVLGADDAPKRFDFVVHNSKGKVFVIETNFYGSGGSKLNETARSYETLANKIKNIQGLEFVWITDGAGWSSAKSNLKETFAVMEHLYCLEDLNNGILAKVFNS